MKKRYVNKCWLENQVRRISTILKFAHDFKDYQRLEAARHFYLSKLVEMDEYGLNYININD